MDPYEVRLVLGGTRCEVSILLVGEVELGARQGFVERDSLIRWKIRVVLSGTVREMADVWLVASRMARNLVRHSLRTIGCYVRRGWASFRTSFVVSSLSLWPASDEDRLVVR